MRISRGLLCGALLFGGAAHAAPAMVVAPTTLDLAPGAAGLFYVVNSGTTPITAQIEALDWDQTDGADRLTQSRTLFASPPLANIAPGERQIVRVLATDAVAAGEIAHRLRVSQLPDLESSDGVRVLLQFSVPVFVGSERQGAPLLSWSGAPRTDGVALSIRNGGTQSVKLEGLTVSRSDGAADAMPGLLYVLPGSTRDVLLKGPPPADGAHLRIAGQDTRSGTALTADLVLHR